MEDTIGLAESVSATVFQVFMRPCVSYSAFFYMPCDPSEERGFPSQNSHPYTHSFICCART